MKTSFQKTILCLFFFACSLSVEVFAADGDILYENYFNSNGDLSSDWDRTSNSAVAISSATFSSSPNAVAMRSGPQSITLKNSRAIDAAVTAADLSVWIRRGDDSFSENPETGEDFRVEYLNSSNNWVILEQFAGNGTPGEIFDRTYTLPAAALHSGLRLRFSNIDGDWFSDYWHLDDVVVTDRTPAPFDLVGKWHLDEANWTGTANQVEDVSGNNLHGFSVARSSAHPSTAFSTPAISDPDGTCGYGIFDGPNRGFVQIDDPGTGSILDFQTEVTVAVWIHPHEIPGSDLRTIISKDTNFEFHINTAGQIFWWWGGGSKQLTTSGTPLQANETDGSGNPVWHHVAITYTSGSQKIYIDGIERASATAIGNLSLNNVPLFIGTDWNSDSRTFDGLIDEVSVYSKALTQSQIQTLMAETHICTPALCPAESLQGGLIGDYYNGIDLSGGVVNARVDGPINFNWGGGSPGVGGIGNDNFSVQWNGYVRATETGQYFFRTLSDDGVRLTVDGNAVISNWTDHASTTDTSGGVTLTAGQIYPVVLEFYERGGQAEIRLQWQTPSGGAFVPIPAGPAILDAGLYSCANNAVGYYEISHSGTGLTCEAEAITISAFNGSGSSMNPPNGTTIVLDTTPNTGTWASSNSFTFDGSAASAVRYLQQTTPATLNINVSDGSASESASADPDITFTDVGIRFYGDTAASPLPNQIAGIADADTVLRVVEASSDTGACVARLQNTNRDVELAYECRNPTMCSSGQTLSLNGTSVQSNNSGASINYSTVNLTFDANGFAAIPFQYSDVGVVRLHSQLDLPVEGDDAAITINGSSSEFVVKPDSLALINVQDSGGSPNPGTQGGGVGFISAGSSFEVRVEGRNALGARTPAFGRETSPENIQASIANLIFPSGGAVGTIANTNAFVPDVATPGVYENNSLSWNEVGSITLSPSLTDGDYLGAGVITAVESNTIGRFFPAGFELVSSSVENSCSVGSFSYLSEPAISVAYSIEARNIAGGVTENYDNADLLYPAATINYHGENNNDGVDLASRLTISNSSWDDGIFSVSENSGTMNRAVDGSGNVIPDGPFASLILGVSLNDIDNANFSSLDFKPSDNNNCVVDVDCDSKLLSGLLDLRFARLHVFDGHGPESAGIPMKWQMEYWDSTQFIINTDDQCTELPISLVSFVGSTTTVDAANDNISVTLGGITSVFDFSDPLGSDNCLSATAIGFCDGHAGINYGAPGSIVSYSMDFDLSTLDFLQGDWNQDGSYDDSTHPRVNIIFENYRGHDRVIYWREQLK